MPISSAFKSSSKKGTHNSDGNSGHSSVPKPPPRIKRSQSVSSISRTKQQLDISSDFLNKRENPLFWSSCSSPTRLEGNGTDRISESIEKKNGDGGGLGDSTINKMLDTTGDRGRSTTRNGDYGVKKGIGRSLSRVRGRSVSIGYVYEGEKEQDMVVETNIQNDDAKFASNSKSADLFGNGSDTWGQIGNSLTRKFCQAVDSSDDNATNWENGTLISSLSEVEDRTIKPVHEQNQVSLMSQSFGARLSEGETGMSGMCETVRSEVRRAISEVQDDLESAIQRNKVSYIATRNIAEIPPDLVNPGAVELVLDIRRAYAQKLEESEERARKLREDLAVEEHRGEELSRILKEVLPDPKTPNPQKSRLGRKRSSERKRNSKRLTEEAMAYFEECVSISTFDSSDFSAPGEPAHCLAAPSVRAGPQENSSINSPPYSPKSSNQQVEGGQDEFTHSFDESKFSTCSTSSRCEQTMYQLREDKGINQHRRFSFNQKTKEDFELHNIDSFLNNCKGESNVDRLCSDSTGLGYDAVNCNVHGRVESLMFDRVLLRNRVESGGLHLCAGSVSFPFSPFGWLL